jgi:phosphatidylinositol-3-phosphatase
VIRKQRMAVLWQPNDGFRLLLLCRCCGCNATSICVRLGSAPLSGSDDAELWRQQDFDSRTDPHSYSYTDCVQSTDVCSCCARVGGEPFLFRCDRQFGHALLHSLAQQYGLAAQYYANAHPSLPNYFMLTVGMTETDSDSFTGVVSDDNVVRELVKTGKSWKCYAEAIPSPGYLGGDTGNYLRHHVPFAYFSDVQNNSAQAANIVPFTQFASDLANDALPQYSFVVPDILDDAHNGTLAQADLWLQQNIGPLVSDANFQSSGVLIVTFDESETTDTAYGGGHVPTIVVSSQAKKNYVSQTLFQHESTLQLTLAASGVNSFPGAAASAPSMADFFAGQ